MKKFCYFPILHSKRNLIIISITFILGILLTIFGFLLYFQTFYKEDEGLIVSFIMLPLGIYLLVMSIFVFTNFIYITSKNIYVVKSCFIKKFPLENNYIFFLYEKTNYDVKKAIVVFNNIKISLFDSYLDKKYFTDFINRLSISNSVINVNFNDEDIMLNIYDVCKDSYIYFLNKEKLSISDVSINYNNPFVIYNNKTKIDLFKKYKKEDIAKLNSILFLYKYNNENYLKLVLELTSK